MSEAISELLELRESQMPLMIAVLACAAVIIGCLIVLQRAGRNQ